METAGQLKQAGCGEYTKSRVLCMLARKFLCNVNDTGALISLWFLVTSQLGQIPDAGHRKAFIITHIVI